MFSFTEKFLIYSRVGSEIIQKGIARSPYAPECKHKKNCSLKSIFHLETDNILHTFVGGVIHHGAEQHIFKDDSIYLNLHI